MTNPRHCDVLIIGAGPAGSSAARELAANGYNVLVAEKFKMPRDKSCSGILINKSLQLLESYFGSPPPRAAVCAPAENRGMVFTNDEGKEYVYEQKGLNIWRNSFDYWLAQKAAAVGATWKDETAVINYEEKGDFVVVKLKNKGGGEYLAKAKIVIDCSGVCSVKRKLFPFPRGYIYTYQTFNKGSVDLDPHYFYAYLQPRFSGYDAWFNVKDDQLIFGVSVEVKDTAKIGSYYSSFIEYMAREHSAKIDAREKVEKWLMPQVLPGCPINHGAGRILFAGEAAGFLNPMGEGISAALESGFAAAKAVQQADLRSRFAAQAILAAYAENTLAVKTYMERQWRFVADLSAKFSHMK
ncbi:MAG: NAD(P)/FAD-dependent oxidoreductase [Gracilibacteraceae bacterium]|jgi:flavin-dependent dehydrogenase|nr:NAD(P)/FAD-dependent oxidoreductase [Gracilibacteraceae bacterium]